MTVVKVNINNIDDVKKFANEATQCNFDIDVVSGRYVIDAKSIMGLFSLDLSKTIEVNIHAEKDECSKFVSAIASLIVK